MSAGAWYILASVSLFSVVSLAVKLLPHLPVEQLIFWRGLICLGITYAMVKRLKLDPWGNNRKILALRGLAGTVALCGFFYTLHTIPLATAVTIQYLSPVLTVFVAGLFFREKVEPIHWVSSILGFVGVYIIQGFDARVSLFDAGMGVMGALGSAFAYNSVRVLRDSDHEWVVMHYFPVVATVASAPFAVRTWVWPEAWDWALILIIGVFTQIAQVCLTRGYTLEKASRVASMNYAGVVYAAILGVLLFDERLPVTTLAGMGVILFSLWLSTRRNLNATK